MNGIDINNVFYLNWVLSSILGNNVNYSRKISKDLLQLCVWAIIHFDL